VRFHDVRPIDRAEAEAAFESGDTAAVNRALVSVAYHDPDWRWVQDVCLRFLEHDDAAVKGLAATCLGHLARIHRQLDRERVIHRLEALSDDPELRGRAEDALDDIEHYLR
jgi:hypothetical protein